MLSGTSFKSAFVFSFNSLILSGFPLTSFHLVEASPSAFSWLYTLVCVAVSTKCLLFIIIHIFSIHFAINLFYLHSLKTYTNYGTTAAPCMWTNEIKTKIKTKSYHVRPRVLLFDLAHKQYNNSSFCIKWRFCVVLSSVWKWLQPVWPKYHVVNNITFIVLLADFDV